MVLCFAIPGAMTCWLYDSKIKCVILFAIADPQSVLGKHGAEFISTKESKKVYYQHLFVFNLVMTKPHLACGQPPQP